jgi:hypothetical protein
MDMGMGTIRKAGKLKIKSLISQGCKMNRNTNNDRLCNNIIIQLQINESKTYRFTENS